MINMKEESSFVASFIEKNGYSPKVLLDLDGKVAKKYDVFGIPVSYLIDKEGRVVLRLSGFVDWGSEKIRSLVSNLINEQAGSWQNLLDQLSLAPPVRVNSDWSPEMVNDWTSEMHTLANTPGTMYPLTDNIDEAFAQQSWGRIQDQIRLAAARLALIINSELEPSTGNTR